MSYHRMLFTNKETADSGETVKRCQQIWKFVAFVCVNQSRATKI